MENNLHDLLIKNNQVLAENIDVLNLNSISDVVKIIYDNTNQFYKSYDKIYSKYYCSIEYNVKKLEEHLKLCNISLGHMLQGYLTLINYVSISPIEITNYFNKGINNLGLADSVYYNDKDDMVRLYRLATFINDRVGYTIGPERKLISDSKYIGCTLMSVETYQLVQVTLTELNHLLWLYSKNENQEKLIGGLLNLFSLYVIVRITPESLIQILNG